MRSYRDSPEVQAMLAEAPEMEIVDQTAWKSFKKCRPVEVVVYMQMVARLAQLMMSQGIALPLIIIAALRMAMPKEGIDCETCYAALCGLRSRRIWAHGPEFCKWWKYQRRKYRREGKKYIPPFCEEG